jgi:hypothetical protein
MPGAVGDQPPEKISPPSGNQQLSYAHPGTQQPVHLGFASRMSRGDAASVALKILGVYLILQGVAALTQFPEILTQMPHYRPGTVLYYLGPSFIFVGAGAWFLLRGDYLAKWILPKWAPDKESDAVAGRSLSARDLQAVAFSVVGVVLIAWAAVPRLMYAGWVFFALERTEAEISAAKRNVAMAIPQLLIGVWLFRYPAMLAGTWSRLRRRKRNPDLL